MSLVSMGDAELSATKLQGSRCDFAASHSSQSPDFFRKMVVVGGWLALNKCTLIWQDGVAAA